LEDQGGWSTAAGGGNDRLCVRERKRREEREKEERKGRTRQFKFSSSHVKRTGVT
jgi:hypothetical protein